MKRCEDIREWMSEYIDGMLDAQREAVLKEHVRSCPDCARELADLQTAVNLVRDLPEVEPPADLLRRVHARIDEGTAAKFPVWTIFSRPQVQMAMAAVLLLGFCIYGYVELRGPAPVLSTETAPPTPKAPEAASILKPAAVRQAEETPPTGLRAKDAQMPAPVAAPEKENADRAIRDAEISRDGARGAVPAVKAQQAPEPQAQTGRKAYSRGAAPTATGAFGGAVADKAVESGLGGGAGPAKYEAPAAPVMSTPAAPSPQPPPAPRAKISEEMTTPPAEKGAARQLAGDDAGAPKKLGAAPQAPGGAGLAAEGALRAPARSTAYKADTATANAAPAGGSSQGNNRMDFSTAKPTADGIALKTAAAPKAPPPPATAAPGRVEANGKIWANRDEGATAPAPAAEQLAVGENLTLESTPTPSKPAPQTDALQKRAVPAEPLQADVSAKAKDTRTRREARAGESKEAEAAKAEDQAAIRSPATLTVTGAGRLAVMKVANELGARTPDKTRKEESLKKAKTDITDVVTVLIPREKYAELLARLAKIGKVTVEPAKPAADEKAMAVGAGAAPAVAAADIRADSDAAFITVHIYLKNP